VKWQVRRFVGLVLEGARIALAARIPSAATAFMCGAVVLAALATAGQTAASERAALTALANPGARLVTITDDDGRAGIHVESVEILRRSAQVETVLGIGRVADVRTVTDDGVRLSPPVPMATLYGGGALLGLHELSRAADTVFIGPVAQRALGWQEPVGTLQTQWGRDFGAVGRFTARTPFDSLNGMALRVPTAQAQQSDPGARLYRIYVLATSLEAVPTVERVAHDALVTDSRSFSVTASKQIVEAQRIIGSSLGKSSRQLVLLILLGSLLVLTVSGAAWVFARRRDFGRRRALGASRSDLALLVLIQTLLPALLGIALAATAGRAAVVLITGSRIPWAFVWGVTLLVLLVSMVASLAPALLASRVDTARILRVP